MARNKRQQDREEKRKEIITTARTLFLNEGYDATSMSRIAAANGIAANTIYWYFKDKDELLVNVLNEQMISRAAEYFLMKDKGIVERLSWVIDQLKIAYQLVATVHARLHLSPELNLWHERFHHIVENVLHEELKLLGVDENKIPARVKVAVFTIEGILSHPVTEHEQAEICQALFSV